MRFLLLLATLTSPPGLPGQTQDSIRIEFDVRIPMRDGVTLSTDLYRPAGSGPWPVIVTRTPYNKNGGRTLAAGRYYAAHGYVYAAQDVRGRGDSDGGWEPYRHEGRDGYDTIEWLGAQSWSTGRVGTIGQSYTGYDQWLAAVEQPPHLAAMVVRTTMTDPMGDVWISGPGGLPTPTMISWYHLTAGKVNQNMAAVDWAALNWHLPLLTMDEAAGRPNPRWREVISHSRLDGWWEPMRYQNRIERVAVPVLHVSGWYDDAQRATPMNFQAMTTRAESAVARRRQMMIIGPWPHAVNSTAKLGPLDFGPDAIIDLDGAERRWFDRWLKDEPNRIEREAPVRLFVMGANRWIEAGAWPVPGTRFVDYYLHSDGGANTRNGDGRLTLAPATGDEPPDRYVSDPSDPVPFLTEPSFAQLGGPEDYAEVETRSDVLVYTAPAFTEETLICGPLEVRLYAASDAPDTDFMAKVLDVWPTGYVQRLNDGMVRARFRDGWTDPSPIEPGRAYRYDIDAWNTCQAFGPGHRLRLEIASSAFPKYDRNPNTGEPLGMSSATRVARQMIFHDAERRSYLRVPIVDGWREANRPDGAARIGAPPGRE